MNPIATGTLPPTLGRWLSLRLAFWLAMAISTGLATACLHVPSAPLSPAEEASRLEARSLEDPALRDFLSERLERPVEPWPAPRWDLDELTLAALFFHPSLLVARADLEVAQAHQGTAAQRLNPTLSILPQRISNTTPGTPPWVAVFELNWTIETGGKRGYRRAVAAAQARAAAASLSGAGWQVRGELTQAAVVLEAAEKRRTQYAQLMDLMEQRVALLEHRVAAGAGSTNDIVRERIALMQIEANRATSERRLAEARVRLAAAIGLSRASIEDIELVGGLGSAWADDGEIDSAMARRAALLGRSDVLAGLADYDAAEANLRLELAQQYPNVQLGPGYEYDQGSHKWGLALSFQLPLLSRNQGAVEEALAARTQAAARFEALQQGVISQVDAASASLHGAQIEREQARRLLQETTHGAELVRRALDAGASDRSTLLAAQLAVAQASLITIDAEEQSGLALARLELAVRPTGSIATLLAAGGPP